MVWLSGFVEQSFGLKMFFPVQLDQQNENYIQRQNKKKTYDKFVFEVQKKHVQLVKTHRTNWIGLFYLIRAICVRLWMYSIFIQCLVVFNWRHYTWLIHRNSNTPNFNIRYVHCEQWILCFRTFWHLFYGFLHYHFWKIICARHCSPGYIYILFTFWDYFCMIL